MINNLSHYGPKTARILQECKYVYQLMTQLKNQSCEPLRVSHFTQEVLRATDSKYGESNDCLRTQYTIPTNDLCHETCRVYVYKDDSEIEVLARSSENGAIGRNTLYSFSSSTLNIHRPN